MFGLDLSPDGLLSFFSQYAYQPGVVYSFIIIFMTMSSFGFPVPEEVVLISSGLVAYLASHPDLYPPPVPGAQGVNVYTLMAVCLGAVFFSDFLVYSLGHFLGKKLLRFKWFRRQMEGETYAIVQRWFKKYGAWCSGIFRFTPGLRFPGHLSCGMLGVPVWKFMLIDGSAALFSVPIQVWLTARYGEEILKVMKEVKLVLFGVLLLTLVVWGVKRYLKARRPKASAG